MNQPDPAEEPQSVTSSPARTGEARATKMAPRPDRTQQILTLIVLILIVVSFGLIVYGVVTDDPAPAKRPRSSAAVTSAYDSTIVAASNGQPDLVTQYSVDGPDSSLSGNAWKLAGVDADVYFYAHMSGFAPGLAVGTHVSKGQVIGYVGDTGNPGPGNFHLHFEYQPNGGPPVNSLALLEIPWPCRIY